MSLGHMATSGERDCGLENKMMPFPRFFIRKENNNEGQGMLLFLGCTWEVEGMVYATDS